MKINIVLTILFGIVCFVTNAQAPGEIKWYEDKDNDGWGTSNYQWASYPSGNFRATKAGDCDDNAFDGNLSNPDMGEVCDGKDNNCDGIIDNVINAAPTPYNLSGPSEVCSNGYGNTTITLSDSHSNVNYQLYRNNSPTGTAKTGTGSQLTWTGITAGTYKIVGTSGASCGTTPSADMANELVVGTKTAGTVQIFLDGGLDKDNLCPGNISLYTNGTSANWTNGGSGNHTFRSNCSWSIFDRISYRQ